MAEESFVEPKAVLGSIKSSSWKFFNFRVSATSMLAERVFSWMGHHLNKRRLNLSGESVTIQLFLKDNLTLSSGHICILRDLFAFCFGL